MAEGNPRATAKIKQIVKQLQRPGIDENQKKKLISVGTFWAQEKNRARVGRKERSVLSDDEEEKVPVFKVENFKGEALTPNEISKLSFVLARIVGESILSTIKKKGLTEKNKTSIKNIARRVTYIKVARFLSLRPYETRNFNPKKKPSEPGFLVTAQGTTPWAGKKSSKGGYNSRRQKDKKNIYRRTKKRGGVIEVIPAGAVVPLAVGAVTLVCGVISYTLTVACGRSYRKRQQILEANESQVNTGEAEEFSFANVQRERARREAEGRTGEFSLANVQRERARREAAGGTGEFSLANVQRERARREAAGGTGEFSLANVQRERARREAAGGTGNNANGEEENNEEANNEEANNEEANNEEANNEEANNEEANNEEANNEEANNEEANNEEANGEREASPGICTIKFCRAYTREDINFIASSCASSVEKIVDTIMKGPWVINNVVNIGMETVYDKMAEHLLNNPYAGGANNVNNISETSENIGKDAANMAMALLKRAKIQISK